VIIREKPTPREVLFSLRGSVIPKILPQILVITSISVVVVLLQRSGVTHLPNVPTVALTVLGAVLGIGAAFRNTSAYDRWWEARRNAGLLIVECRGLSRQAVAYLAGPNELTERIGRRCIALTYLTRDFLRSQPISADAERYLRPDELSAVSMSGNPPNRLLQFFSADIADVLAADQIHPLIAQMLESRVTGLSIASASLERTKFTPMPFVYTLAVHRVAYLFCLLLPFGIADPGGWWTPLITAAVAYVFFGLDAIGDDLSTPFATDSANTLPLDAISRTAEIDILETLGETNLPLQLKAHKHVLT
jgi:ion channel-forming bestrophin family protein